MWPAPKTWTQRRIQGGALAFDSGVCLVMEQSVRLAESFFKYFCKHAPVARSSQGSVKTGVSNLAPEILH